jgi:hypothetical protein
MKNLLYILLFAPLALFGQEETPCYSINELYSQLEGNNPAITNNFAEGWNMFGFSCLSPTNVEEAFSSIVNDVLIVKDNSGNVYLPEWGFNGLGDLVAGAGYQAKFANSISGFTFCDGIVLPNIEELAINGYVQEYDSTESNSFYLGILDESQYIINYWQETSVDIFMNVEIISPQELVEAIYIGFFGVRINGVPLNIQSQWLASNLLDVFRISSSYNILYSGDIVDITFITSKGIFTIQEVFGANSGGAFPVTDGCYCPYNIFIEYNSLASELSEDCCETLIVYGCTDPTALNYDSLANDIYNESCEYIYGCIDSLAPNYNSAATFDDESCIYYGCTNELAFNFDASANIEDGSCIAVVYGCTIYLFPNYNSAANTGNNSCDMTSSEVFGCTDSSMVNYNQDANIDNGICDSIADIGDELFGGIIFQINEDGTGLVVALNDLTEGATDPMGMSLNGYEWGCNGENVIGTDGTSIGSGLQNTMDITSQGCATEFGGITAAQAALNAEINGYSDWYLPSKDELVEIYNTIGNGDPEGNIGGFETSNPAYWSSSELNSNDAWFVDFSDGTTFAIDKYYAIRVRVIRAF